VAVEQTAAGVALVAAVLVVAEVVGQTVAEVVFEAVEQTAAGVAEASG